MNGDLRPPIAEPIKIDKTDLIVGCFAFAIIFFLIGSVFRHYVWIGA